MNVQERAVLRDLVARRRLEQIEADEAAADEIDVDAALRAEAGRAALKALAEAQRRSLHGRPAAAPLPIVPAVQALAARTIDETLLLLAQLRAMSPLAARIVDSLPPLELCADNFDPVEHARVIIGAVAAGEAV